MAPRAAAPKKGGPPTVKPRLRNQQRTQKSGDHANTSYGEVHPSLARRSPHRRRGGRGKNAARASSQWPETKAPIPRR